MINQFRGNYYFLSNMYICDIEYKSQIYKSVEHAYVYHKHDSIELKKLALTNIEPTKLKIESKKYNKNIYKNWNNIKLDVMYDLLKIKFSQSPFTELLIATKDENIVEGNVWNDTYWGVDINQQPNIGENHLGRIIMRVRDEIIGSNKGKKSIFPI